MFSDKFRQCKLVPAVTSSTNDANKNSSVAAITTVLGVDGKWKTSSFYLDSSGRSSILLPLQLSFGSRDELLQFVTADCFTPKPSNYTKSTKDEEELQQKIQKSVNRQILKDIIRSIGIEAKVTLTFGTGSAWKASVEGLTILSTRIGGSDSVDSHCTYFNTEIIVRVSKGQEILNNDDDNTDSSITNPLNSYGSQSESSNNSSSADMYSGVKTNLEIRAVYTERYIKGMKDGNTNVSDPSYIATMTSPSVLSPLEAMNSFNSLYGFNDYEPAVDRNLKEYRTIHPPLTLHVDLTHAVTIGVKSYDGPKMGQSFISFTMSHSNTHQLPVTITSISLHPGHSKYQPYSQYVESYPLSSKVVALFDNTSQSKTGGRGSSTNGKLDIADMSKFVRWGYVSKTEPALPLTLRPNEAYATIITVDASEDVYSSRMCSCPLSITALVGSNSIASTETSSSDYSDQQQRRYSVVAAVDAMWSTSPAPTEPADAFRIEMSFENDNPYCVVGSTLTVLLDIYNLSIETRQLMLLIDTGYSTTTTSTTAVSTPGNTSKSTTGRAVATVVPATPGSRHIPSGTTKSLVVSDHGGYKFGVWGLSSRSLSNAPSSSSTTSNRDTPDEKDSDMLAVDVALLLGEVKGLTSTKAKLRVVPLQEGVLRIPTFKLVDSRSGQRYNCYHRLYAIVSSSNSTNVPATEKENLQSVATSVQ
jgi:hypothetical protein